MTAILDSDLFRELDARIAEASLLPTLEQRARAGCEFHQKAKYAKGLTDWERRRLFERIYTLLLDIEPKVASQWAWKNTEKITVTDEINDAQAITDRMVLRASKSAYLESVQDAYNYTLGNMKENTMNVKHIWVRVKAGYVGQITVNGTIVWESTPKKNPEKALAAADKHSAKVTARLFA